MHHFRQEFSTDQVNKLVNLGSLTSLAESFPTDTRQDIDNLAPMLSKLGYDSHAFPPNYGTPDPEVSTLYGRDYDYWIGTCQSRLTL